MQIPAPAERRHLIGAALERLAATAPTEAGWPGEAVALATLAPPDTHAQAVLATLIDLLALLGALHYDSQAQTVRVPSVQAGYLLRLVQALHASDAPLVADWQSEGLSADGSNPLGRAVDLLALLEQRRRELQPDAPALRETRAAVGLVVRAEADGGRSFLLIWDAPARAWQLIGGQVALGDGSLRATLLREMAEELRCPPLIEQVHLALAELGPPATEERVSPTYGLLTRTTFQVYTVHFLTPPPPLPADARWVSEAELRAGITRDQQPIAAAPFVPIIEQHEAELALLLEG